MNNLLPHSQSEVEALFKNPTQASIFEDYEDFQVLVLRGLDLDERGLVLQAHSYVLKPGEIHIVGKDLAASKLSQEKFLKSLNRIYRRNRKILDLFMEQVTELERQVFSRDVSNLFMDHWAKLKSDLSKLDSYFFRNVAVYREFYRSCEGQFGKRADEFKDIEDTITYQQASVNALKTQLDGVHHFYDSLKTDRLNKTLLGLTVISGIFLPLNLIVGFFGMNTPGLFLMDNPQGTKLVMFVLIGVFALFVVGFPLVQLLDRLILRYFLGRFDLYRHLRFKLEDVSKQLKGE